MIRLCLNHTWSDSVNLQEVHNLLPCNWYWCIEQMQNCICRRVYMGKFAKTMKMSWQNTVPKCVKGNNYQQRKTQIAIFRRKKSFFFCVLKGHFMLKNAILYIVLEIQIKLNYCLLMVYKLINSKTMYLETNWWGGYFYAPSNWSPSSAPM